ncbi:MAG: zinc ABC transporter substrate-binding protein [Clostridia bacterium]|nr:zinc ABC transporter substrate-binding protein [Clostridia bacterium]
MKKLFSLLILVSLLLSSCTAPESSTDSLSVVSVSFPGYSLAKEILGETADVTMLLPLGTEAHGFEPTPKDILKIQNADVFIYGGGDSEHWVDDILSSLDESVTTLAISKVEGISCIMEEHAHPSMFDSHIETDEHVWLSIPNSVIIIRKLTEIFKEKSPENSLIFEENSDTFIKILEELDLEFRTMTENAPRKEIVVGDRFPFRYLAHEYNINYHSAFPSCSGEAEPSASKISELTDLVKKNNIPVVFYTEFSNQKVANIICENNNAKPMLLHSCHNVSKADFEAGITYYHLMRTNYLALKEALY